MLDADIRGFFDTICHEWMRKFVEHRIGDRRVLRLIEQWLHARILEDGTVDANRARVPQGGRISPLLANVYLHYALDQWVARWWRLHATGDMKSLVPFRGRLRGRLPAQGRRGTAAQDLQERLGKFALELIRARRD